MAWLRLFSVRYNFDFIDDVTIQFLDEIGWQYVKPLLLLAYQFQKGACLHPESNERSHIRHVIRR